MSSASLAPVQAPTPCLSGRYRIAAELGRGGMGAVYRAHDLASNSEVALKTLELGDDKARLLFEREYCTLASLKHPCVVEVFDFGIAEDGRRYYTMELLTGDDLAKLAPLPVTEACEALRDVATSLALLHAQRLLHGDISPRNVRIHEGRAKLLDFGAAAPFGVSTEIIGTPECMAPEVLRQRKLDARTDLFSLGALAYFALTGRAAYPVRDLREAEAVWSHPPLPPSKLAPNIPKALDHLIASLLSIDPKGRPATAAEVIDRLSAIGNLDERALSQLATGQLHSSTLIGRDRERTQLRQHLARLSEAHGGVVVLEGATGMGRSRMSQELAIDARIAGLTAIRIEALAHPGPLGTLHALARGLLQCAPAEALETLPGQLSVLGHAFPELLSLRPQTTPVLPELSRNPAERRSRIQAALCAWVLEVAARRPLVVIVDDVQASDSVSLSALTALGRAAQDARLLLCVTRRTDGVLDVGSTGHHLERFGARIKLRGLQRPEIEKLLSAVFGDAPHRARLLPWLMSVAGGNPGRSLELLRGLVDHGVIRYASGAWVLPAQVPEHALPKSLGDALASRIAQLSPGAAQLLQLFALFPSALPRRVCFKLLPEPRTAELFEALDQLLARGLLVGSASGYLLGQDAVREIILEGVDEAQLRALHCTLGRALLDSNPEVFASVAADDASKLSTEQLGYALQAGWHLARGGDHRLGRKLLRNAGIALTLRGDGLIEAVPALDAALRIYRQQGRSRFEQLALLAPLTLAGTYFDWRLSYAYGDETLDIALELTGLHLARKLERFIPAKLALLLAVGWSFLRFQVGPRRRAAHSFREALLAVVALGTATLGTSLVVHDRARALRVSEQLSPLALFPRSHAGHMLHVFHRALIDACFGRYQQMAARAREVLQWLGRPGEIPMIPAEARSQLEIGVCNLLGQVEAIRTDGSVHEMLDVLEQAHVAGAREIGAAVRLMYYAHRGERARFVRAQEEVDVLAAQAGSTWRHDLVGLRMLWLPYALCEDVMGLKSAASELERASQELPWLAHTRDVAQACYLAERQRPDEALARYEASMQAVIAERSAVSLRYAVAYARILRAAGRAEQAKALCDTLVATLSHHDQGFMFTSLLQLEAALARAELGDPEGAATALDQLIDAQADHDNPLVHGLVHKGRAQVALMQRDRATFGNQLRAMHGWFLRTDNPALIGQCQRLSEDGRAAGFVEPTHNPSFRRERSRSLGQVAAALSAARGRNERLQAAIELIVEHSGAEKGYLYVLESDGLRFVAPSVGIEPPEALRGELMSLLHGLQTGNRPDARRDLGDWLDGSTTVMARASSAEELRGYEIQFLLVRQGEDLVVVGAVALIPDDEPLHAVEFAFLEEVARGIHSAGDVCTVLTGAPLPSSMSRTVRR